MKSGWFGPKTFGWGAQPTGWQGWLATLVFIVIVFAVAFVAPPAWRVPVQVVALAVFLAVVGLTFRVSDHS